MQKRTLKVMIKQALLLLIGSMVFIACEDDKLATEDPYAGGKQSLGIEFRHEDPYPSSGRPGDRIVFSVNGLLPYKDSFKFFINGIPANVISVSAQTVAIEVPENVSTGVATIEVEGQGYIGPVFNVDGKITLDKSFGSSQEANGGVYDYTNTPDEGFMLVGSFTDYNSRASSQPVNRIALITKDGLFRSGLEAERGANGSINAIEPLADGKYIIGGSFSTFNNRGNLFGLTRLNANGSLDTTIIDVINPEPNEYPEKSLDTVATFNGGVLGQVVDLFARDGSIWVVGNFRSYYRYFYARSTYDNKVIDRTEMRQVIKIDTNGVLDSTFNYNPLTGESYEATNGFISDVFMQADKKLVIVGRFSSFNGQPANNIVRLKPDGSFDESFRVGSGANDAIENISYSASTQKIMIAGDFTSYDGKPVDGVAMLNLDGSLDASFQFSDLDGVASFAHQLSNGKVLVSGSFETYQGVVRQGFMVLNADGSLAQGYNNTGTFQGRVTRAVETTTPFDEPAVLLTGNIFMFDNQEVDNIIRLIIKQ